MTRKEDDHRDEYFTYEVDISFSDVVSRGSVVYIDGKVVQIQV